MKSSRALIILLAIMFIIPSICKAEVINLNIYLNKVQKQYRKLSKSQEILDLEKEIRNSAGGAYIRLSGDTQKIENNDSYTHHTDASKEREKVELSYSQDFKYGPNVELTLGSYKDRTVSTYSDTLENYKSGISLHLSQDLYKNLIKKFYSDQYNDLFYESQKKIEEMKENYVIYQAILLYINYLESKEAANLTGNSIDYIKETINAIDEKQETLFKKIRLANLEIEKDNLALNLKSSKLKQIELKYQMTALIGEKYDEVEFADNSLDRDSVLEKYKFYIDKIYNSELEKGTLAIKLQKLAIKNIKNNFNPSIRLLGRLGLYRNADYFSDTIDLSRTNEKDYSIGLSTRINIFNPRNKFEMRQEEFRLKEIEEKQTALLKEKQNKNFVNERQKAIIDGKIKILMQKITNLQKNLELQKSYMANILETKELSSRDTDYEINKFISLLHQFENAELDLYSKKLSWVERYILKRYENKYPKDITFDYDYRDIGGKPVKY